MSHTQQPTASPSAPPVFAPAWWGTDIGDVRPCDSTYLLYPYESLPPLASEEFTGAFTWLAPDGPKYPIASEVEEVDRIAEALAGHGLTLPRDFVTYHTSANLYLALDRVSPTGCYRSVSQPLPSPVEPGAFMVRFLRDQQDCVLWHLYLRPSGETFVVSCLDNFEYLYGLRDDEGDQDVKGYLGDTAARTAEITWSAPGFEEFAYRMWVENRLWYAVRERGEPRPLAPGMERYLEHYRTRAEA